MAGVRLKLHPGETRLQKTNMGMNKILIIPAKSNMPIVVQW
jgi:hypothetical protein